MIEPIYKPFDMVKLGVIEWRRRYAAMLEEAKTAEDQDVVELEIVPEELPHCKNKAEFDSYLEQQVIERLVRYINAHTSGTVMTATGSSMLRYWTQTLKWKNPGYDIAIYPDGSITVFTDLNTITNGVAGVNSLSWNICTIGGIDDRGKTTDTRTPEQKEMLHYIVSKLHAKATEALNNSKTKPSWKTVEVKGHRDHPNVRKACPCYDAIPEFSYLQL